MTTGLSGGHGRLLRLPILGEVYPCGYLPVAAGNLSEQPFAEMWGTPVFEELRDTDTQPERQMRLLRISQRLHGLQGTRFRRHRRLAGRGTVLRVLSSRATQKNATLATEQRAGETAGLSGKTRPGQQAGSLSSGRQEVICPTKRSTFNRFLVPASTHLCSLGNMAHGECCWCLC